jgi:hypothetical protein
LLTIQYPEGEPVVVKAALKWGKLILVSPDGSSVGYAKSEGTCEEATGRLPSNSRINATVRPVTLLAVASSAPVRPARYAWRWTDRRNQRCLS